MAKPGINSQFNIRLGSQRYQETHVIPKGEQKSSKTRRKIELIEEQRRFKEQFSL